MTDIKTTWDPATSKGDWEIGVGDLVSGSDLETAIYISLFTDRLAREDDVIDGTDRRGWWGDTDSAYAIGSRIWLLKRQKLTPAVAKLATGYAEEALQWLIDDGVLGNISITTQITYPRSLYMLITYQKPAQQTSETVKYQWVWES